MNSTLAKTNWDVVVIGGGPAGLSTATALKKGGVDSVLVLDRETEMGGIPRHCGHPPFGIAEYKKIMTGPVYARRIAESAIEAGVSISNKSTVTQLGPQGKLTVISPEGYTQLSAKRVVLATGVRETPRSARLISGSRGLGICNTGALQSMVYLKHLIPFRRPVVIGTEIVSFSALLTCKKAGIRPVAMVEESKSPTVQWPIHYAARFFGVPLLLQTTLRAIHGKNRVEAIEIIDGNGKTRELSCDGVVFTGRFTPESSLIRASHLALDQTTGSPIVDAHNRCSDPAYYAAGNILQPVTVAGKCWKEGQKTAQWIIEEL